MTVRIAMWSGPRSLSTALMRSFEARGDCRVTDEPLYAFYLDRTGLDHPLRDEVIASQPTDWRAVVAALRGPCDQPVWYAKHMAHHLLPEVDRAWLADFRHAFLVRHPGAIARSYARARERFTDADLGMTQLLDVYRHVTDRLGQPPIVVDHDDVLADPPGVLRALCAALRIPWTEAMLAWPAGRRPTDGVWAPRWYGSVEASTGFAPPESRGADGDVSRAMLAAYTELKVAALRSDTPG